MTILKIQEAFKKAGFQWVERIYNDEIPHDCYIELTRDRSAVSLSEYPRPKDCVGWGRFSRQSCWDQAYEWLQKN